MTFFIIAHVHDNYSRVSSGVANSLRGGGGAYSDIRVHRLSKQIDCVEHGSMNMSPPPIIEFATPLQQALCDKYCVATPEFEFQIFMNLYITYTFHININDIE